MSVLLALLIATVFVVPVIVPDGESGRIGRDLAFSLMLLGAAATVYDRRPIAIVATLLCLVAIGWRWLEFLVSAGTQPMVREGASLLALALATAIAATRVFAGGAVTADRVTAAVVLYLLLGMAWSVMCEIVALQSSGAFAGGNENSAGHVRWMYFSFVTLTTVAYGDITPVPPAARSLAVLEALVGQLYPAVILARLVSLHAK